MSRKYDGREAAERAAENNQPTATTEDRLVFFCREGGTHIVNPGPVTDREDENALD